MMENNCPRVSPSESTETDSSIMKRRKKRQWDQPADSLVSMGTVLPGILPLSNMGFLAAITSPGIPTIPNVNFNNSLASTGATLMSVLQAPLPQNGAAIVQKLNQPKIQDELIAREIVINDADSALRYKLTKRQTQEEIQKCTNAIVITRGKYRPPTAPLDGEKPLYLHISAGAHLETTVERIKAVDSAAAMVEEILKNGCSNNGVKVNNSSSACVFLGFEADPSLDIAARIRGPNDQYVNHIMNETGATILLKGRGSGNSASIEADDGQQPLHLFLSSSNSKNLERAKLLAENLLDTISAEFGASRVSSSKVYGAVPPPPQLLAGVQSSGAAPPQNNLSTVSLAASTSISVSSVVSPVIVCSASDVASQGIVPPHPGWSSSGQSLANTCSNSSLTHGTSYIGYGGIYPQATPLQQVAQVLRQSTSPVTATVGPVSTAGCLTSHTTAGSSLEKDKRSAQKRKFQELPAAVKRPSNLNQNVLQGSELPKLRDLTSNFGARDISNIPASRELIDEPSTSVMLPPPSRRISPSPLPPPSLKFNSTSMPPPPPKFSSALGVRDSISATTESRAESVPDTLVKLLEYGDDDDDDDDEPAKVSEESLKRNSTDAPKPFWAV